MAELGILCHVTCLNNSYGLGDFGKSAYEFVDFLKEVGASVWEVLPLNLTNDFNCPYGAMSVFSFDEMFVDLEELCDMGLLEKSQLSPLTKYKNTNKVMFSQIKPKKLELFTCAYNNLTEKTFLEEFANRDKHIFEYAYWRSLLEVFRVDDWHLLDKKFWKTNSKEAKKFVEENKDVFLKFVFFQYTLKRQWLNLKDYANKSGIKIFGDLPAYCDRRSVEVFAHPQYVKLNKDFLPSATGGAPVDMFGDLQDWGTCVYDWKTLAKENYSYMIERMTGLLEYYDILRLDHFMAYAEHFEIPKNGKSAPHFVMSGGEEFFESLLKNAPPSRFVVEDLGTVKESCREILKRFKIAGMKVLQYAFDGDKKNPYLPENVSKNCVFYTETHDGNTFMGFLKEQPKEKLHAIAQTLACENEKLKTIQISAINSVLSSKAKIAMIPIQDLMFLDERFRMNRPGVAENCWEYRLQRNFQKKIRLTMKKCVKKR